MKSTLLLLLLALFSQSILAHTKLSSVYVNGASSSSLYNCVRPHPATAPEFPIVGPYATNNAMTCGWLPEAANPAPMKCAVHAGDIVGSQWWHNTPGGDILDPTHRGPITVYIARWETTGIPTSSDLVWVKIYQDGYSNGEWATDRFIKRGGSIMAQLPTGLQSGNYLMRFELLALHQGYNLGQGQFYVGCLELSVTGGSTPLPGSPYAVAFPGAYHDEDAGIHYDIYNSNNNLNNYPIPGPAVYGSGATSGSTSSVSSASSSVASSSSASSSSSTGSVGQPKVCGNGVSIYLTARSDGSNTYDVNIINDGNNAASSIAFTITNLNLIQNNFWNMVLSGSVTGATGHFTYSGSVPAQQASNQAGFMSSTVPAISCASPGGGSSTTTTTTSGSSSSGTSGPANGVVLTIHQGSSQWWVGLDITNTAATIQSVQVKDSNSYSTYSAMVQQTWGWQFTPNSNPLTASLTFLVTASNGHTASATFASITPGASVDTCVIL